MNTKEILEQAKKEKAREANDVEAKAKADRAACDSKYTELLTELDVIRKDVETCSYATISTGSHSSKILIDGHRLIKDIPTYVPQTYIIEVTSTFLPSMYMVYFGDKDSPEQKGFSELEDTIKFIIDKYAEYIATCTKSSI